jgi:hypothetical protein
MILLLFKQQNRIIFVRFRTENEIKTRCTSNYYRTATRPLSIMRLSKLTAGSSPDSRP